MSRPLGTALLLLALAPGVGHAGGVKMEHTSTVFASVADAQRFFKMAGDRDFRAMDRLRDERMAASQAWWIKQGTEVYVMDKMHLDEVLYECIRPRGETRCGWNSR